MSTIVRYSSGSTYTIVPNKVDIEKVQDLDGQYHIPYTSIVGMMRLGLGVQKITVSGDSLDMSACLWHDVVAISFDSGTSYQTVYFSGVPYTSDCWSGIYPYALSLLASPLKEQTAVRYPTSTAAWYWGNVTSASMSQAGNVNVYPIIHYLAPLFYAPLSNTLIDFAGQSVTFTRTASKVHGGVTYGVNVPIYDNGLYLASDTAQDVATWTPPASTVRTVAMQVVRTRTSGAGTLSTIWSSAHNTLQFYIDWESNGLIWTDGTNAVQVNFPAAAWTAGTVLDVVVLHDAANAVTLIVHPAGGSWTSATETLAALTWPQLTLGNLEGSIANLIEYPYVLTSAEYQAIVYSSLSLLFNTLYVGNRYASEVVKGSDKRLLNANGSDISALLGGVDIPIGASAVTITQTQGMAARWYVEVKRTDV